MTVVFRSVDPASADFAAFTRNIGLVFHDSRPHTPEAVEFRRGNHTGNRLTAAFDGDVAVGTFISWDTGLTVPGGGTVTADAISGVTVRPTHRRRGILTRLMTDDLAAAAARGVPVAILFASEAVIYPRYGFGVATRTAHLEVDARRAVLRPEVPRHGRVDVVEAEPARAVAEQVLAAARRAGEIDHKAHWLDDSFGLRSAPGDTPKVRRFAVHTADDGTPTGYLRYRVEDHWEDRVVATKVHVDELRAATPQAYLALWRYLLELDLVATVVATERPVDDPLPWLVTDRRSVLQTGVADFQWHRLLDPAAALSARRYERAGAVTFEVVDRAGGWAAGTYSLETDDDGTGRCTRTDAAAEVTVPVDVLSSVWLGDGDLRAAAWSTQAVEHRDGALDRLAGLLRTAEAPWTRTVF